MKRIVWSILALTILLSACGGPAPAVEAPAPVLPVESDFVPEAGSVVASAVVVPAQIAHLGFTISALVKDLPVKEGETVQAGQTLMILNAPELEFAAIAAEQDYKAKALQAELQKADKVKYVNPNNGKIFWFSNPREVYLKALSKADQAKALWDLASVNLAQATLTAPFGGTVADILVLPGETVQANQAVLTLATLDRLQIETTDLSERDIAKVGIGDPAEVFVEALEETVKGKVIAISPIADEVGGDVVFKVTIELEYQPRGLLWGMTAEVNISE